jgi:hypothetical protein
VKPIASFVDQILIPSDGSPPSKVVLYQVKRRFSWGRISDIVFIHAWQLSSVTYSNQVAAEKRLRKTEAPLASRETRVVRHVIHRRRLGSRCK